MKISIILNIILAVAVVVLCIKAFGCCGSAGDGAGSEEAVLNNIATRTSIRKYTDEKVTESQIEKMLRAGMAAPTARNAQPWHFVVVSDRATLDTLSTASAHTGMLKNAPLAIVVCGNTEKALEGDGRDFWIQDASAATENILLAAHALGLGAVWTGLYPVTERSNAVSDKLNLPGKLIPMSMVVIGHPAESPAPKDKYKEDNVSFIGE